MQRKDVNLVVKSLGSCWWSSVTARFVGEDEEEEAGEGCCGAEVGLSPEMGRRKRGEKERVALLFAGGDEGDDGERERCNCSVGFGWVKTEKKRGEDLVFCSAIMEGMVVSGGLWVFSGQ
ncbi:hypothetical protein HAX54_028425 [Datura stramonium]|uniref:Uncharacterized protein n=1 Tax=Datura stramonium TaxID=4076 RepID=A0ABS8V515_DATST|nr:hypothetical protein [Datura stramonium]